MGIRLSVYALSEASMRAASAQPDRHGEMLARIARRPEDMPHRSPLVNRLRDLVPSMRPRIEEGANISLDVAWHAIHCMLTGTAWEGEAPEGFLLSGGVSIVDEEAGIESRLFAPPQVQEISRALLAIEVDEFTRRFDRPAFSRLRIYPFGPAGASDSSGGVEASFVVHHFLKLRSFVSRAAVAGLAIATCRG